MNPFSEKYKSLDLIELLKILEQEQIYQPLAIQTAKEELANRNPSAEELNTAKRVLADEKAVIEKEAERKKEIKSTIAEFINPIKAGETTTSKSITIIALAFGLLSIYLIYDKLPFLIYLFKQEHMEWDESMIFYSLPMVIVPLATILFWRKQKSGWILLFIYLTFNLVLVIGTALALLTSEYYTGSTTEVPIAVLFFTASIWAIARKNIREAYSISLPQFYKIVILTLVVSIALVVYLIA